MRVLKVGGVIVGALLLTTLGISASDTLRGNSDTMLAQLMGEAEQGACPAGMTAVVTAQTFSCIDTFEASAGPDCPFAQMRSGIQTIDNIASRACEAVSIAEAVPWTFVTREQAVQLCARSGKRLPTAAEWYQLAIDTPDDSTICNIDSQSVRAAESDSACRSAFGAVNAVGNVWEWVSDDVIGGQYNGRPLPPEGYVTQVDSAGVATAADSTPAELFGNDYLWSSVEGSYGMLRGGYFGSQRDGGIYAIQAKTAPTAATAATGFRCVM